MKTRTRWLQQHANKLGYSDYPPVMDSGGQHVKMIQIATGWLYAQHLRTSYAQYSTKHMTQSKNVQHYGPGQVIKSQRANQNTFSRLHAGKNWRWK